LIAFSSFPVWIEFGENVAVAIALASIIIALSRLFDLSNPKSKSIFIGIGFGLIGIAIMLTPVEILPGIPVDARLIPVSVAGLFGGPGAAILACGIVAAIEFGMAGPEMVSGMVTIVAAGALGGIASKVWVEQTKRFNALQYFGIGVAVFVLTVCSFLALPNDRMAWTISTIAIPAAIFIPLGTMLLGILMSAEYKRADADAELRRHEAQFREVIENSPAAVYLKDPDGRYRMINQEYLNRFQLVAKDVIGNTADGIFPGPLAARLKAQDKSVIAERRAKSFEVEMAYADGTTHAEIAIKFPIFGDDGAIVGIGGVTTDITEWAQAKAAVRRIEERYQEFFENAELVFLALDKNGRISSCNDHLASLTGHDRDDIVGADWIETFIPDDERSLVRKIFHETMKTGAVAVPPHFENDILAKDGTHKTISWDSVINRDAEGRNSGITCVGVDVTARRHALIELHQEKERAEQYLAIAGSIIVALDARATITLINRKGCEVLGHSQAELIGANWIDTAIPEDQRQGVSDVLGRVMAGKIEPVECFENEVVTKSGARRLIAWTNSYISDNDGNIVASLSSGEDITDRTRAENEAKALQTRLAQVLRLSTMGEMAAGFAHELNQPLAAINNYAQGTLRHLRRGKTNAEDLIPALEKLSAQAERAGEVIRRIRWFVQKNAPDKTPTDLNQTIRNAAEFMQGEMIEHDIVLDFNLGEDLPKIPADAVQIQQVVMNLSRNAIEAMKSTQRNPRRLTIGTTANADAGVEISVSDTGPGLSPDVEAELFEPFVTDKPDGMGIGLSICRSLVQAHGGSLRAESVLGEGTTFRFTIPQEPADQA
jgi:PAS domain S-box-containing protein